MPTIRIPTNPVKAIYEVECDIDCPCDLGDVINEETLGRLKCKIICGCAKNHLADERIRQIFEVKKYADHLSPAF